MALFICAKCKLQMSCTQTGRLVVYRKTTVYHGDQYSCPDCEQTVVFTNSKSYEMPGILAKLNSEDEAVGFEVLPSIGLMMEVAHRDRNVNELSEQELRELLGSKNDLSIEEAFSEAELVSLVSHPAFQSFEKSFREQIWDAVCKIFKREIDA